MAPRIRDLTADELARHAANVFLYQGRTLRGARLIYQALALDPGHASALGSLSDFLDQPGTEVLSAVVLEHALDPGTGLTEEERAPLEERRFRATWWWGFARHDSGQTSLTGADFDDRSRFTLDAERYQAFLAGPSEAAGGLGPAARRSHLMLGTVAGLLSHVTKGDEVGLEDLGHPELLERTPEYDLWLDQELADLEGLERARRERRWPGPEDVR